MKIKNVLIVIACFVIMAILYVIFYSHEPYHVHEHLDEHIGHGDYNNIIEKTHISDSSAKKMGIVFDEAKSATIKQRLLLTGRITLNQNKKAMVRARFPGIVKEVKANLGDQVIKDQVIAIIESNESLRKYEIIAPIDGAILEYNTNVGDVTSKEHLFMIADLSTVWAKFHVFSRDAESVLQDQIVNINTIDDRITDEGKINLVFPTADELSQTHIVIVELKNQEGKWKPGMTIEGSISTLEKNVDLAIKENALQKLDGDQYVVFVKQNNEYNARPVTTGIKGDGYIEITSGLKAGEMYVSDGSYVIKSDILKSTTEHVH